MKLVLYFDGSCWPNPGGPAKFGWRALLDAVSGTPPRQIAAGKGAVKDVKRGTNNVAEYGGLRATLDWASCLMPDVYDEVIVRGDSLLVIQCIQRPGRHKSHPDLARLHCQCRDLLTRFQKPVRFEWVSRKNNREADALSHA